MTDNEIIIKVAEFDGWKWVEEMRYWIPPEALLPPNAENGYFLYDCPDYLNDLNACHEFEKLLLSTDGSISQEKMFLYASLLRRAGSDWHVHATARQRCMAFIKVMEIEEK